MDEQWSPAEEPVGNVERQRRAAVEGRADRSGSSAVLQTEVCSREEPPAVDEVHSWRDRVRSVAAAPQE